MMKLSQILYRQHIAFMFKKHWLVQGKRVPIDTGVEDALKAKGIEVVDALEFVKENQKEVEKIDIVGPYEKPLPLDKYHPEYKGRPCFTLKSNNVLLQGLSQAQVLTKSVLAENKLPSKIEELAKIPAPKALHENAKKAILSANVFDCEQKKLPKKKDPERPAFNFPRILGITDRRRNIVITNKLLQLLERSCGTEVNQSRYVSNDVECRTVFMKERDLIQFQDVSNILVTDKKPIKYDMSKEDIQFTEIPDLYPIKYTVTLPPVHFYDETSNYPINRSAKLKHPHTTWLHFNVTEVGNIYETKVTSEQIHGRSLTHAFSVASSYAKQLYGEDEKDLPEPIYVNCIQTDGRMFHFGVLELNTLNVSGTEGTKNVWYCKNDMPLYSSSQYSNGIPVLEKYNPRVYEYINAFYNS